MESIISIRDFLLNPDGFGFPILIGCGLGAILYLMRSATKQQKKAEKHLAEKQESLPRGPGMPFKPF
ncbi:MAG: hypothetical protein PHY34_02175 [Patescibacteria group bacterium]|nr:hypothetical protein [Patescibacteria group bacterium]MDD5715260.1 hypothetical protein [Patescibacteria group bacterium]